MKIARNTGASLRRSETARLVLRILGYYRDDLRLIFGLLALAAASTALGLLQAWPFAVLLDTILSPGAPEKWLHRLFLSLLPEPPTLRIAGLALIALALRIGQELVNTARRLLGSRINYTGLLRVRCELFRKLQAMHLDYHRSQPVGDRLFRLTTDTLGFRAVLNVIINALFAAVTLCAVLALLIATSASLAALAVSIAPALFWVNVRFGRTIKLKSQRAKRSESAFTTVVERSLSAIGLTQAFGREDEEYHRFGASARRCVRSWFRIHWQEVGYTLSVGAFLGTGGALILSYGGNLVYEGRLSAGELMVFMAYLGMIYDPLCQITGAPFHMQNGLASARRVFEVLDRDILVRDAPDATSLPLRPRALELHRVSFQYPSGRRVLRDVSVRLEPGRSVAFLGSSGAGKSTLLSLLPRFYDPTSGRITLDGRDLRRIRIRDLRRHIALVLQESIVLPATVAENIAYGRPEATQAEIEAAARLAGADAFIASLPRGYRTSLLEGGANLSGGQRQRLALARALLTRAPILLLDEPTSALDVHQQELFARTLRSLAGKRTVVLVTHHVATAKYCDLICVLEHGTIAERGRHAELIALDGLYASMARRQASLGLPRPPPAPASAMPSPPL